MMKISSTFLKSEICGRYEAERIRSIHHALMEHAQVIGLVLVCALFIGNLVGPYAAQATLSLVKSHAAR